MNARPLTPSEYATLRRIIEHASFTGASELREQLPHVKVRGGFATSLKLEVGPDAPRSPAGDGPIPLVALVEAPNGEPEGEILVWLKDGYLSGLEFAWVTDEDPTGIPSAERIRFET